MSTAPTESLPAVERRRLVVIGLLRALATTATSQVARVVVIAQMLLDLLVLGLVVKVFLGAVEIGRGRRTPGQDSESS